MMRRTTVTADEADLDTLRAEARRRGISLSKVLAETVAEKSTRTPPAPTPPCPCGPIRR